MSDETRDDRTLDFYASHAPVYAATGAGGTSRHLSAFLDRLPVNALILELGCGGGRDAEAMIAAGFRVDPTDASAEIVQKAQTRLNRPVRVMRFDELEAVEAYDAVWANASLIHVPRSGLPYILRLIYAALKPGGLHFASYQTGGTERRDSAGRYFNHPFRDELMATYAQSGPWETLAASEYEGGGYEQGQGPWIALTLRKPS